MELISESRLKQQQHIHTSNQNYDNPSDYIANVVSDLINANHFTSVLDYGSGKGWLMKALSVSHNVDYRCYDPAVTQFERQPSPEELSVCTNVLEHVEPEKIDSVLDHLQALTQKLLMLSISHCSTMPIYQGEGSQPLISHSSHWWLPKIVERFTLDYLIRSPEEILILAFPLDS